MSATANADSTADGITWHAVAVDDVVKRLATDIGKGLAANEAATRLQKYGPNRLPEGKKRRRLERAFKFLREDYAGRILDFTEGTAVEWGRLIAQAERRGRKLSVLDSQIEATAVHFGLTVVTRNSADFFHPVFNRFNEAVWPNSPSSATFNIRSPPCSSDSILLPCFSPCTLVQVTKPTGRYLFAHSLPDSTATP